MIFGDPEFLQKVFTNILLNAIQSLPKGQGASTLPLARSILVKLSPRSVTLAAASQPEQLQNIFRPFQTTKERRHGNRAMSTRVRC